MLSIIMCVYQNKDLTVASVENLLQTTIPFELIVIDNGCTDGTAEYLENQKVRVITNPANRGIMPAWNQGLAVANGDYLMFTCNDITVHPGNAAKMLKVFDLDSGVHCVTTDFTYGELPDDWWERATKQLAEPITHKVVGPPFPPNPAGNNEMQGGCFVISREGMDTFGRFDENLPIWYSDVDIWCSFNALGHPVVAVNTLVHHLGSQTTAKVEALPGSVTFEESRRRFEKKWGRDVLRDYQMSHM